MVETVVYAIGDGPVVVQGSVNVEDFLLDLVDAANVKKGFLLAGERGLGKIFGRGRGPNGDADIAALAQILPCGVDIRLQIRGQNCTAYCIADRRPAFTECRDVVDVQDSKPLTDALFEIVVGNEFAKGVGSCRKAGRNGDAGAGQAPDHLAERGILTADAGDIVHAALRKINDAIDQFLLPCFGPALVKNRQAMGVHKVFFVSDQTGVTVETLGHSLLEQFDDNEFDTETVPFVDTVEKARSVARRIDEAARSSDSRPIVFASLVQDEIRSVVLKSNGLVLDFFDAYLGPLEAELESVSSHRLRRAHGIDDSAGYNQRIDATNFALAADDGHRPDLYDRADIILVGVSRSGKTPTCLYLALQYGIFAANYPLADDELEEGRLPGVLTAQEGKLYGLTIRPDQLQNIRQKRRAEGQYASAQQVSFELRAAESLFRRRGIPFLDTTHSSIEEIASTILSQAGLVRRVRA